MRERLLGAGLAAAAVLAVASAASAGGFASPAAHLVPADPTQAGAFGAAVAVSADGSTALVGGDRAGSVSRVEVDVRSGSRWTKQGDLLPHDLTANASFGSAVALSADGNTALVGDMGTKSTGECDAGGSCTAAAGMPSAVWVFTRTGTTWTQQGPALSPPTARGVSGFGSAIALSADGSTALVGAHLSGRTGAAWVFTRTGSTWGRAGTKLAPSDETGRGSFGWSVALSWDGRTALVGAPTDTEGTDELGNLTEAGAAWFFERTGSGWKQAGPKLTAPGGVVPEFGKAVALSGDGDTALVTGDQDGGFPTFAGAVWTFARAGSSWKPAGPKLLLADPALVTSLFGSSLTLSAGGDEALVGGIANGYRYVWQFTRAASGAGWKQGARLPTFGGINFGQTMALTPDGATALVGTNDGTGQGSVYVFTGPAAAAGKPSIASLAPASGKPGDKVTIAGANLKDAAAVSFGAVAARFTVVSATRIAATVPAGATTAPVTAVTPHGAATSAAPFTVSG
jgi:FG-GAP repeat/IPT/TIG domain